MSECACVGHEDWSGVVHLVTRASIKVHSSLAPLAPIICMLISMLRTLLHGWGLRFVYVQNVRDAQVLRVLRLRRTNRSMNCVSFFTRTRNGDSPSIHLYWRCGTCAARRRPFLLHASASLRSWAANSSIAFCSSRASSDIRCFSTASALRLERARAAGLDPIRAPTHP